jgi:hypothetical protein
MSFASFLVMTVTESFGRGRGGTEGRNGRKGRRGGKGRRGSEAGGPRRH